MVALAWLIGRATVACLNGLRSPMSAPKGALTDTLCQAMAWADFFRNGFLAGRLLTAAHVMSLDGASTGGHNYLSELLDVSHE